MAEGLCSAAMHLLVRAARNSRINPTATTPPAVAAALSTASGTTPLAISARFFRRYFSLPDPTTSPCSAALHSCARLASASSLPASSASSLAASASAAAAEAAAAAAAASSLGAAANKFLPSFQSLSAAASPLAANATAATVTAARCATTAAAVGSRAVAGPPLGLSIKTAAGSLPSGATAAVTAAVAARGTAAVAARLTATAAAAAPLARSAAGLLQVARSVLSLMGAGLTALAATQLLPGATVHASERPSTSRGRLHVPSAAYAASTGVTGADKRADCTYPAAPSAAAVSASWWWPKATADGQSQMPSQVQSPLSYHRSSHVYDFTRSHSHTLSPSASHGVTSAVSHGPSPPQRSSLLSAGGSGSFLIMESTQKASASVSPLSCPWGRPSHLTRSSSSIPPLSAPTSLPPSASAAAAARRACSPPAAAHSVLHSPPAPFPRSPPFMAQTAGDWQLCTAASEIMAEPGSKQAGQRERESGREGEWLESSEAGGWTTVGEGSAVGPEGRGAVEFGMERGGEGGRGVEAGGGWELVAEGGTDGGTAAGIDRGIERATAVRRAIEAPVAMSVRVPCSAVEGGPPLQLESWCCERSACVAVTGESRESRERREERVRQSMWQSGSRESAMGEMHSQESTTQPSARPLQHRSSSSSSSHTPFSTFSTFLPCSPSPSPSSTSSSLASSSAASASPCSPLRPMAPPRSKRATEVLLPPTCSFPHVTRTTSSSCTLWLGEGRRTTSVAPPYSSPAPPASPPLNFSQPAAAAPPAAAAQEGLWEKELSGGTVGQGLGQMAQQQQQQGQDQQRLEQIERVEQQMRSFPPVHSHESDHSQEYEHGHGHGHGYGYDGQRHGHGDQNAYELLASPAEAAAVAEALCHSQSRAREAEQAAAQAECRQQWLEQLLWHESTRSYSFRQWALMLQLQVEKHQLLMLVDAEASNPAAAGRACSRETWGSPCFHGCAAEPSAAGAATAGDSVEDFFLSGRTILSSRLQHNHQPSHQRHYEQQHYYPGHNQHQHQHQRQQQQQQRDQHHQQEHLEHAQTSASKNHPPTPPSLPFWPFPLFPSLSPSSRLSRYLLLGVAFTLGLGFAGAAFLLGWRLGVVVVVVTVPNKHMGAVTKTASCS
ncbi:hypothetical protein CLOM_g12511 [Closterium sp. NIES-68]|nr:hypothetical protein CLOM_g12511 [Closterium sp. NIES-68]GJP74983.1 hypothetical protein CLOP_g5483 [Closterium sp. NIES-67]